ncbi:alpha-E domain-containing protein [Acidipropionibacterium jensenii]|uniref:Bacterial domain of uncharacterized function (DUF403) n=1 Tax=Acidipropionibacterium jensenii TaxID=1749 RepID=A0A3S4VLA1_9ACTN|nr:alpha-E domain-containing protein [Acidipropionibacterium jensenii]MDN5977998.1 alpha-E domain-containing protein [Acidipropionibacterium jensenii]MDN5996009.1 alpha-E domain-containing protein [Acidipropionibacterium jensenii]MDN6427563.1 alpha-E domain-containing protein [Acidipropionibacterium jensenii]MDN6442027.1 alpha-E domain-containing protein [Acidipropionibacterium jensenii]MDN6481284.1 alpha-E domain-containing protein [Acidipropionibacterium jensenii]
MLSRMAESMFWIGRYLERAEDVARILQVHLEITAEETGRQRSTDSRALLASLGAEQSEQAGPSEVWRVLGHDPDSTISIVSALSSCRQAARRAREVLSLGTWEEINRAWRAVAQGQLRSTYQQLALRTVLDHCYAISGIIYSTMSHDEGWEFHHLGRSIERIDVTARLISVAPVTETERQIATLRACGADHAFLISRGGDRSRGAIIDFLLRDRLCPRSVVHCLAEADACLERLDVGRRTGFQSDAQRLLGRVRAEIEYRSDEALLVGLPDQMAGLSRTCHRATDALSAHYFQGADASQWHEG